MKGIPREVGSLKKKRMMTNSRSLRILRERLALDSRQEEILAGTLLGDAHLECTGWNTKYRLQLVQGNAQNCCASAPSYQRWNDSWRVRTVSHLVFSEYAQLFYRGTTKIIPCDIAEHLTPQAIAIWFMDDGALGPRGNGYILNTQSFSLQENKHLVACLQSKFKLKTTINKDRKWWRLYISTTSQDDFTRLISSYIIPTMRYKLRALDPVETTRRPLI